MSYGLEVSSPFGGVLIDENIVSARRIAVHTISVGAPSTFGTGTGSLTVGGAVGNYVALTSDARFHTVKLILHGAGGYTLEVWVETGAATSIQVTILGFTPPVGSTEFGLEVFSPAGSRVFSSAENNIALLDDVLLPLYTSTAQSVAVNNVPVGRTIMMPFAYGVLGFDLVPVSTQLSRLQTALGRVAGNTIEIKAGGISIVGGGTNFGYDDLRVTNYLPIFLE